MKKAKKKLVGVSLNTTNKEGHENFYTFTVVSFLNLGYLLKKKFNFL